VTCHGSINSAVLHVNSVAVACARRHNEERTRHPDDPEKARAVSKRLLSIQRFYRYIAARTEPGAARDFFREIDSQTDQASDEVLVRRKAKRDEIRARAGVEKEPETDAPR